ncbi:hypothetical protein DRO03_07260 [Methanosarcinales archaeon]|nr:MAG: hypothetical protein DRO03_07260 [Methanosarcinales archaeon]
MTWNGAHHTTHLIDKLYYVAYSSKINKRIDENVRRDGRKIEESAKMRWYHRTCILVSYLLGISPVLLHVTISGCWVVYRSICYGFGFYSDDITLMQAKGLTMMGAMY